MNVKTQRYAFWALLAAALFGASTPLAKLLLGSMEPVLLASLLYLGSGIGLGFLMVGRRIIRRDGAGQEASLALKDLPWLAGAIAAGGILAPLCLLFGLRGGSASGTSLLLNLEGVLTTLLAGLAFREAVARRVWVATFLMLAAGLILSYNPRAALSFSPSSLLVVGACGLWALDNNLTRKVSAADPMAIAMVKGLVAGSVNFGLALSLGEQMPSLRPALGALGLGMASYGISLVLFVLALRHLGSARTSAHFSTAPFLGAAISIALFHDPLTPAFLGALLLIVLGTYLVLTESHEHEHSHEQLEHTHLHVHDEHHQHHHDGGQDSEPHSHPHTHEPMTHRHAHLPDIHHRHGHS